MAINLDEPLDAEKGEAALRRLRDADPALYLSPSADLAAAARPAFDAEQIWSQIELLSRPLIPHLRRQLRRLEQQPPSQPPPRSKSKSADAEEEKSEEEEEEEEGEDGKGDEELEELDDVDDEEESEEEEEEGEDKEGMEGKAGNVVEDKFFKIKDLDRFIEKGEEAEYGGVAKQGKKKKKKTENWMEEDSDEEDEEDLDEDEDKEDEEDDDEHLDLEDFDDEEEEEGAVGDIMYKDFFEEADDQKVRKKGGFKKVQFKDEPEVDDKNDDGNVSQDEQGLSTHEKARLKMRAKIEEMEKANLEPSTWTMQGEVNASSRPKNSALEVDLDFEHNVRPVPVITEEVTASLEEMIKKRIIEGHFDDVEKPSPLQFKAPKEQKDLDESKSKKGLAELYEDDYAQKTDLAPAPLSISDELKNEANTLFKRICLKLDALSHFHFAPKPVIEDMSIQANVPALAMEEIAPVAVSDAAMLAPEEVFEGKGDVKEEAELTQAERKRRRANKKRRYAGSHKERPTKMQKD
uniref:Uncharacterized protein n=1 Tax=Oryza punctata TaxID=4537 RepID=A0A0E0MC71_ORYPU